MRLCFISNLFPRPDNEQRGMFNRQLVGALGEKTDIDVVVPMPGKKIRDRRGQPSSTEEKNDNNQKPRRYTVQYLPVRHIPLFGRNMAARFHEKALNNVGEKLRAAGVVLASWLYPDGVAAANLCAELGVPVWIEVLGSDIFHLRNANRRKQILDACKLSNGIICVAQHLKDTLVDSGVEETKLHVVPNGIDSSVFKPVPEGRRNNEVLWVGNLVDVKKPEAMLEVWQHLERQDLKLVIIGDGPLRKPLESKASTLQNIGRIEFLGNLPHAEVAQRMAQARLLCLTSRSEGMPNVILEALASGLPVVATDVGGVKDMLKECDVCRVVETGEGLVDRFACAVAEVAAMEVDRAALAAKHSLRSWGTVADEILELMGKS